MKVFLKPCKVSTFFLFCVAISFASCGSRSDEEIKKDVSTRLAKGNGQGNLNFANVQPNVEDGVLTLTGQCEGENCVDSLTARFKEIDGIKTVKNEVTKTASETDHTLRTSVQAIISKYQGVQADVAGGVVVLRGTIQRDQVQPLMNELSPLPAKKLDNQLAIQ